MKRNWYALTILLVLALFLAGGGWYVQKSTQELYRGVQQAYACTHLQDYDAARTAYYAVAAKAEQQYTGLTLLLRRNLVDQLNQTLATLPSYANPDNQQDLSVENARACAQIKQLQISYFFLF